MKLRMLAVGLLTTATLTLTGCGAPATNPLVEPEPGRTDGTPVAPPDGITAFVLESQRVVEEAEAGTLTIEASDSGYLALVGSSTCPPVILSAEFSDDSLAVRVDPTAYATTNCTEDLHMHIYNVTLVNEEFSAASTALLKEGDLAKELKVIYAVVEETPPA